MSDKKEVSKDKRNIAYVLTCIALIIGFFLAKKYYAIVLLWGIIPFPVTLGDRYIFLLDDPIPRIKSLVLGLLSLCVTVYFIRRIYQETDAGKKLKFGVISLITSILFSLAFYVITPSYTFQNYPQIFMYMDSKGAYIQNPDYYFWLVDHLGFYQETYRPFKTLDDAIKGLDFAKQKDDEQLYLSIFRDLDHFGYDRAISQYNDLTFYVFFVDFLVENPVGGDYSFFNKGFNKLKLIETRTNNNYLKQAINNIYVSKERGVNFGEMAVSTIKILQNINDVNNKIIGL